MRRARRAGRGRLVGIARRGCDAVSACDPGAREPNLTLGLGRVPRPIYPRDRRRRRGHRCVGKKAVAARKTTLASVTEPFIVGARAPLN